MGRSITAGQLVRLQADFFSSSSTRATGVVSTGVTLSIFYNNSPLSWVIRDGTSVADSSISAGSVYFNEITGAAGFYSVRFFPDRVGYWRIVLRNTALAQESVAEFDANPAATNPSGLQASFIK